METAQKEYLLKLARRAVEAAVYGKELKLEICDDPVLNEKLGCFVTLKTGGQLRGCLGRFISDIALYELVSVMAREAALEDPRFIYNRLGPDELGELAIEISVLSELQKTSDPLSLRVGVDGIYIRKGYATGCFLPQVATEAGWNAEQFLSFCCSHKAGLEPDAWKDKDTEVYLFTAEVFGEND